jgi:hypothetical protein
MKKIYLILFIFPILGLFGCVKQKHCENDREGFIVVCKKPYDKWFNVDIHARFYLSLSDKTSIPITSKLPKKYTEGDTFHVRITEYHGFVTGDRGMDITCIEEIN